MLTRRGFMCCLFGSFVAGRGGAEPALPQTADGFVLLRAQPSDVRSGATNWPLTFGSVPGPLIRVRRGEDVKVRLENALDEPTAIHWHGLPLADRLDGAAALVQVAPGASFDYRFVAGDASTFWYHAAALRQHQRGLFGALIVEETPSPLVDRDVVLVFAPLAAPSSAALERADAPLEPFAINGAASFDLTVHPGERLRLRFINAATAGIMDARIADHRLFVMALDGEPAEPFMPRDGRIVLGPGNRADVFLDAKDLPVGPVGIAFANGGSDSTLLRLVYEGLPMRMAALGEPTPLPANALPQRMNFARAARIALPLGHEGIPTRIGSAMPLFVVERGRTVVLALANGGAAQVVHIHGHHFRLLDRLDDGWKPYWLDTVLIAPRETVRVAFVVSNAGRFLIETRPLDGEYGYSAWFQVK